MILSFYFAQPNFKTKDVVLGQYAGVISLVVISLSGIVLGQIINPEWIKWLGLFPIFLGLKGLYALKKKGRGKHDDDKPDINKNGNKILSVALITFANGGDNIGVYTPLFATTDLRVIPLYLIVFMALIAVWCFVAHKIGKHALIKRGISKFGHIILPVFLLLLGGWIIFG